MKCRGKQRLIWSGGLVRARSLDNVWNAIGLGSKMLIWAMEDTKADKVSEIRRVTAMGKLKRKGKISLSVKEYPEGGKERIVGPLWLKAAQER